MRSPIIDLHLSLLFNTILTINVSITSQVGCNPDLKCHLGLNFKRLGCWGYYENIYQ